MRGGFGVATCGDRRVNPLDAQDVRQNMWKCVRCSENVEDNFDVCWNCGTSSSGVIDPSFSTGQSAAAESPSADDGTLVPEGDFELPLDERLAERFVCARCSQRGAHTKRIAATGTGLSKLFDIQHNQFICLSCKSCGFTEFYDPDILEKKRNLGTILDLLFGS